MSTLFIPSPAASRAVLREDWTSAIVVGSDGRQPSNPALAAGAVLAGSAAFGTIGVLPAGPDDVSSHTALQELRATLDDQISRMLGESCDAWIDVRSGYPPAVLAAYAATRGVSLLVVGIGRPLVVDRLNGDESVLRLARMTQTPLFAVAERRHVPPRRVVVGTDFSATSMRAARLALSLASPDAEVSLVYVHTATERPAPTGALRRHVDTLQTGFCGRVSAVELGGDAGTELLAYATHTNADVIAIGKRGTDRSPHGALGPVATRVVRCASCSIALAPSDGDLDV
jgi:nucleotide-binding universal stress UspA family protein